MKPDYHIVIPARYASTRLPAKPLLELSGIPLLQHVWQRAGRSRAQSVIIATDDERIMEAATAFGATVMMTERSHQSGSDRIAECADRLAWPDQQLVINLQGDEPLMPPACLDQVARLLTVHAGCELASLYWPITVAQEVCNPNVVKVITDQLDYALYFSRLPIPYARNHKSISAALAAGERWKRHLGLYAWRCSALRKFSKAQPTPLEQTERLEQLRVLEQGGKIAMAQACEFIPGGVDTQEDLDRIQNHIES